MGVTFDADKAIAATKRFLWDRLADSALEGYVVGLSGGVDSALAATLCVEAVGSGKVLGVLLPYRTSSPDSLDDALELIKMLGIEYRQVDISPMIDAYYPTIDESNRLRAGNKMARERMSVLFDIAHQRSRLVLGTGNRTEICLGYTTWFGDSACSLNPLGQLYKTEVRQLARRLGVPKAIVDKAPSADLWQDQTDEGEIGVTYERIDAVLRRLIDDGVTSLASLTAEGFDAADIDRIVSMVNRNAFKRALPEIAQLGLPPVPSRIVLKD